MHREKSGIIGKVSWQSGIIRINWEGELAIVNFWELSGIIGTQFLLIFPDNSQLGKIRE
jgi:hypothetical protein